MQFVTTNLFFFNQTIAIKFLLPRVEPLLHFVQFSAQTKVPPGDEQLHTHEAHHEDYHDRQTQHNAALLQFAGRLPVLPWRADLRTGSCLAKIYGYEITGAALLRLLADLAAIETRHYCSMHLGYFTCWNENFASL